MTFSFLELKADACLYSTVRIVNWDPEGSMKEVSSKSEKYSPQRENIGPEKALKHLQGFRFDEVPGAFEAASRFQELCHQWLQPEIHSKEQIMELLVLERFLTNLPQKTQDWLQKHHLQNLKQAVTLAQICVWVGGLSGDVVEISLLMCLSDSKPGPEITDTQHESGHSFHLWQTFF
uniref:SCAN box domain-containing protein n=1 Tax=Oryctolagus cuniculus TaxID=9986 RepID=G1TNJ7_RABIT